MSFRADLPIEVSTTLDATGAYVSDWIDTAGMRSAIALYNATPGVEIEQSMDMVSVFGVSAWTNSTEKVLAARFFRLRVVGATPNAPFTVSVKVTS